MTLAVFCLEKYRKKKYDGDFFPATTSFLFLSAMFVVVFRRRLCAPLRQTHRHMEFVMKGKKIQKPRSFFQDVVVQDMAPVALSALVFYFCIQIIWGYLTAEWTKYTT